MAGSARRGSLTIGALSRATGIPPGTLRTWERRYDFPRSVRKPSGHRLYPIEGIPHLLRIKAALALGHRPAEILRLPSSAIEALVVVAGSTTTPTGQAGPAATERAAYAGAGRHSFDFIGSVVSFDRAGLGRALRAQWASLGPVRFLDECAGPFLESLGKGWREGRLEVRHEHFASSLLAGLLGELRQPYDDRASGPWVAAATLPGDRHELGLLMASLICAVRGWRVLYIGIETPVEQIAALSREAPLAAVALSVSPTVPQAYACSLTLDLRRTVSDRIAIWIGGKVPPVSAPGVLPFGDLDTLDRHLAAIAGAAPPPAALL